MDDVGPGGRRWHDGDWGFMHGGMGWGGWLMMLLLLLLLVGLVVGIVLMLTTARPTSNPPGGGKPAPPAAPDSAEQVLGERYARGEIDEEEYLRRRAVLRGG